jgi:hypothetical protein
MLTVTPTDYQSLFMKRIVLLLCLAWPTLGCAQSEAKVENVILITLDGLRWQEVFTGADAALIRNEAYVGDTLALMQSFWDDDPMVRREKLMPFFWNVIATEGQLYGNRAHGSKVNLTNGHRFSYPGYNEILTGFSDDDRIDSNSKVPNPNVTMLEFVNRQDAFRGKVAAFGSWDVFPYIINETRSGIPVNAGFGMAEGNNLTAKEEFLNELQSQIPSPWGSVRLDAFTHNFALEYLNKNQPRLLYIAYGETDDFAHDADYDAYLHSARRTDGFIRDLWTWIQSHDAYRDKTAIVITTDHGRGLGPKWTGHGDDIPTSAEIWIAAIGPSIESLGEIKSEGQYYQNQVANTVATLLGLKYTNARSIGAPVDAIVR